MIEVSNLTKEFRTSDKVLKAVNNVSFTIPTGKFASIIGKSGSGKTTLLALLGGLDYASSGKIMIDDTDMTKFSKAKLTNFRAKEIGFIFQSYNLIPNLSALENVMLPMEATIRSKHQRILKAKKLLKSVMLKENEINRKPAKLSGGQQQRVAIARALANDPKLILADEPTGNLDSQTGKVIFELLHNLAKQFKTTILTVTHDLDIAGKTDMIFTIKDGKLVKDKK